MRPSPIEIVLPATSANLGPAFDAAGIAMRLHYRVRAKIAREFSIEAHGRDAEICRSLHRNLVLETYGEVLESAGKALVPLSIVAVGVLVSAWAKWGRKAPYFASRRAVAVTTVPHLEESAL